MAVLLKKLWMSYELISEQLPDPRTKSWPLVFKPHEGLPIIAIYVLFVLKWGPMWMKNRRPYDLKKILILHNVVQVVACAYIFHELLLCAWAWDYRWICEPIDYSENPKSLRMARAVFYYYLTKYLDLLDTVFFVLRKKMNQVSFLHVFHHAIMVIAAWGAITYFPGGHGTFVGLVNSFVHVLMYSYYLLTTVRPAMKRSVWWKKHLTQLQIVQLTMICFHLGFLLVTPDCKYPWWIGLNLMPSNFFMLCLFVDFYIKKYIKNKNIGDEIRTNGKYIIEHLSINVNDENEGSTVQDGFRDSDLRQRSFYSATT